MIFLSLIHIFAVLQSEMGRDYIKEQHPGLDVEILTMKTTGDKILDRTLDKVGGKGLFVKELDKALLEGRTMPVSYTHLDTEVLNISRISSGTENWKIETTSGTYETKCIINAAGVYADRFHNMVSEKKIHIIPRKGEYCLLDKSAGSHVSHTVFALPGKFGKGVLVTPTVHGNLRCV